MLFSKSLKKWLEKSFKKDFASHCLLHIFNSKRLFLDLLIANASSTYFFPYGIIHLVYT